MFKILFFFILGILIGFFLKNVKYMEKISEILVIILIAFFLFIMGFSIGNNEKILFSLNKTFIYSLVFSIAGITGSIFFTSMFFKK